MRASFVTLFQARKEFLLLSNLLRGSKSRSGHPGSDNDMKKRQGAWDMDYGWGGGRFGKRADMLDYGWGGGRFGKRADMLDYGWGGGRFGKRSGKRRWKKDGTEDH